VKSISAEEGQAAKASLFEPFLEAEGITPKYLAKKLKRELNAKETKFFQKDGEVVTEKNCVAWDVRQKARIDAHKLLGHYPAEKIDHNIRGSFIVDTGIDRGNGGDASEDKNGV
jgi:hypothetical protein